MDPNFYRLLLWFERYHRLPWVLHLESLNVRAPLWLSWRRSEHNQKRKDVSLMRKNSLIVLLSPVTRQTVHRVIGSDFKKSNYKKKNMHQSALNSKEPNEPFIFLSAIIKKGISHSCQAEKIFLGWRRHLLHQNEHNLLKFFIIIFFFYSFI